ncbi:SRPBCC domain-containing protein [uncultured Flavobacterium sp.]|uniref:SRPBCC domain-containing protein n=1 Tax=uncultured Flavobacterium sp. TaxID=165435 RepID=UPI0025D884AB|nr:SRPBCC domain-containing protein [uncultured Flavobacterium sp.]
MELKTKVHAEDGKQELTITRVFELPVRLLFRAYEDADIFAQWMGTKVLKYESCRHGSYSFETNGPDGNVAFRASGVFHEFLTDKKIIRTFEMEDAAFGVQLEFLEFESLTNYTSKLTMHIVYRSGDVRDQMLKLPFAYGISMAHDRLEEIVSKVK